MALIYPSQPDPDTTHAEKRVFGLLAENLPKNWVVFHARRLVLQRGRGKRPIEREVDFIVLDPDRGYLGLEVKGGDAVGRDDHGWYSIDVAGTKHLIKDPGKQAQDAVHTLDKYLRKCKGFESRKFSYGWGVVFPGFSVRGNVDPALPRDFLIDRTNLQDALSAVTRLFEVNGIAAGEGAPDLKNAFISALAPTVQLAASLADRIATDRPVLVRLTQEQINLLNNLESMDRLAIQGGAGTGKTMLAMEKARRLAAAGQRVILLCYNKPLAEFLQKDAEGFTVKTFHGFCREKARAAGLKFSPPKGHKEQREFWGVEVPVLLCKALEAYPDDRYDAVIVDEGQDFEEFWWDAVDILSKDREGLLYAFFDANQTVFGDFTDVTATLDLEVFNLKYNCRNTQNN